MTRLNTCCYIYINALSLGFVTATRRSGGSLCCSQILAACWRLTHAAVTSVFEQIYTARYIFCSGCLRQAHIQELLVLQEPNCSSATLQLTESRKERQPGKIHFTLHNKVCTGGFFFCIFSSFAFLQTEYLLQIFGCLCLSLGFNHGNITSARTITRIWG